MGPAFSLALGEHLYRATGEKCERAAAAATGRRAMMMRCLDVGCFSATCLQGFLLSLRPSHRGHLTRLALAPASPLTCLDPDFAIAPLPGGRPRNEPSEGPRMTRTRMTRMTRRGMRTSTTRTR